LAALPLENLLAMVRAEVNRFTGNTELADDCTLLASRRQKTLIPLLLEVDQYDCHIWDKKPTEVNRRV
jgi:hypothetical protein